MQSLLLECAVRAVLIAAATALVLVVLRVKSAAARHAAWLGVVVWMLLLPAWTAWVPKARLRVLPAAPPAVVRTLPLVPASLPEPAAVPLPSPAPPRPAWNWWIALVAAYALGAAVLLARLAIGAVRAHALMRSARDVEGHWTSSACVAPVTVGWLRPAVILPEGWREWTGAQLAAVMAHEREHARRRDPLMQFLALLNRSVFWFHPLAWWLEHRLSALAEEACDSATLACGHDPYDYSRYLLDIARAVERTGMRVNVLGMAMPGSSLPQRIRRILGAHPVPPVTRTRMACAAGACLLLSSVFAAGTLVREKPPVRALPALLAAVREAPAPTPAAPAPVPVPPAPQAPQAQKDRLVVLYFPLVVLNSDEQARAVAASQKFVETQMQPADRVAIMVSDAATRVLQDFTSDHTVLLQALSQVPNESSAQQDPGRLLEGLQTVVNMLGSLKEKKALIYFARPMPGGSGDLKPVVDSAIRANVAIYPVDVSGLAKQAPREPPAPAFDAASVKLATPAGGRGPGGAGGGISGISFPDPASVSGRSASLRQLIQFAYDVRDSQVAGPDWINSERYNIEARAAAASTQEQRRQMMQVLLVGRFSLALHRETKDLPVYEMTAAEGGARMPEVNPGATPSGEDSQHHFLLMLTGTKTFAAALSHFLGEMPVVDKTGLTAKYRFAVDLGPGQSLISAVREQLGLNLTAANSPAEILVVDHAERVPVEH